MENDIGKGLHSGPYVLFNKWSPESMCHLSISYVCTLVFPMRL